MCGGAAMVDSRETRNGTARRGTTPAVGPAEDKPRELMPMDGSIAHFGHHASIYCAPCCRWVDCHDGIRPETALERHAALLH